MHWDVIRMACHVSNDQSGTSGDGSLQDIQRLIDDGCVIQFVSGGNYLVTTSFPRSQVTVTDLKLPRQVVE